MFHKRNETESEKLKKLNIKYIQALAAICVIVVSILWSYARVMGDIYDHDTERVLSVSDQISGNYTPIPYEQRIKDLLLDITPTPAPGDILISPTDKPEDNSVVKGLSGKIICIDPGSGKKYSAKSSEEKIAPAVSEKVPSVENSRTGISTKQPEYDLNYEIALKLKDRLEMKGCQVIMTKEEENPNISNIDRANIGNNGNADIVVSIHANLSTDKTVKGITVLIPGNKYQKDEKVLTESKKAGQAVLGKLIAYTGAGNKGLLTRSDMALFNWSRVPVMSIKTGYLSSKDEDELLKTDEYRDKIAAGIEAGLENYFS